jgi:hypothetical protein
LQLFKRECYSGFLLEVYILPPLSFLKIATIPQLFGGFLVELGCCFGHLWRLHHAGEEADLCRGCLLLLGFGDAHHDGAEEIVGHGFVLAVSTG